MRLYDLICRQSLLPPASLRLGVSQFARLFHSPTFVGSNRSYQRFVILGQPRCGTRLLVSALNQHTAIHCLEEVYHPDHVYGKPPIAKLYRDLFPIAYLQTAVFRGYPDHIQAVGFKALAFQLRYCRNALLVQYLRKCKGMKFIHIYRENVLKRYLSEALARRDERWRSPDVLAKPVPIRINLEACEREFKKSSMDRKFLRDSFAGHQLLSFSYEGLVDDMATGLSRVQEHIGVPVQAVAPTTAKQRKWPVHELITNWDDLNEHFAGTSYEQWFRKDT